MESGSVTLTLTLTLILNQVPWKRICNSTAAALASTPVYNLQVKVVKATFTATGKCHDTIFSCPDKGDTDAYVEVALNAQFMDQPANTRTNVVRLSTHIPDGDAKVDCPLIPTLTLPNLNWKHQGRLFTQRL